MAQLTIEFTRDTLSEGFYLGVDVLSGIDVDPFCLVATIGRANSAETLARVATLNDLVGIPEAPSGGYAYLQDPSLSAIVPVATDRIQLNAVPALWEYLGYTPGTIHEVLSWNAPYTAVEVTPEFPAFGGALSYTLYDSGMLPRGTFDQSGAAILNILSSSWDDEIYYRFRTLSTSIKELGNAINKLLSLQTQAQSLVDNTEKYLDEYGGTSTEVYE